MWGAVLLVALRLIRGIGVGGEWGGRYCCRWNGRLRYSGASIDFQLAAVFAGGPTPMIATAILAATGSGQMIALYIFGCAIISIVATALLPSSRGRDFARDYIYTLPDTLGRNNETVPP